MTTTTFDKIESGEFFRLTETGAAGATGMLKFIFKKRTDTHAEIMMPIDDGAPDFKELRKYEGEHRHFKPDVEVVIAV